MTKLFADIGIIVPNQHIWSSACICLHKNSNFEKSVYVCHLRCVILNITPITSVLSYAIQQLRPH